jgi:hypothetical protein
MISWCIYNYRYVNFHALIPFYNKSSLQALTTTLTINSLPKNFTILCYYTFIKLKKCVTISLKIIILVLKKILHLLFSSIRYIFTCKDISSQISKSSTLIFIQNKYLSYNWREYVVTIIDMILILKVNLDHMDVIVWNSEKKMTKIIFMTNLMIVFSLDRSN